MKNLIGALYCVAPLPSKALRFGDCFQKAINHPWRFCHRVRRISKEDHQCFALGHFLNAPV